MEGGVPAIDVGGGIRNRTLRSLRVSDVQQPFFIKEAHVEVKHGLLAPDGHVIEPCHPLVPLGAVGGDAVHVAPLGMDHGGEAAFQHRIAAGEAAGLLHTGRHLLPLGRQQLHPGGQLEFRVAEAVIGKTGVPGFPVLPFENVAIPAFGSAQILLVDPAVRPQVSPCGR